jgi:hypothetical protein
VSDFFAAIADRGPAFIELFARAFLDCPGPLQIHPTFAVQVMISALGTAGAKQVIVTSSTHVRDRWLFALYHSLPDSDLSPSALDDLVSLYENARLTDIPVYLRPLMRYRTVDPHVFSRVTRILIRRTEKVLTHDPFVLLFNRGHLDDASLLDLFSDDPEALRRAYFLHLNRERTGDYRSLNLRSFVQNDPSFLLTYLDWEAGPDRAPELRWNRRDMRWIWSLDNADTLVEQAVSRLHEREADESAAAERQFASFFGDEPSRELPSEDLSSDRQGRLLERLLLLHAGDASWLPLFSSALANFSEAPRGRLLSVFLEPIPKPA